MRGCRDRETSPAQTSSAAASSRVSTSSSEGGHGDHLVGEPFASACCTCRARDPGPNCGSNVPSVASASAFVPRRAGRARLPRRAPALVRPARASSRASISGQSPGTSNARSQPSSPRSRQPRIAAARLALLAVVDHRHGAGDRATSGSPRHDDQSAPARPAPARRARPATIAAARPRARVASEPLAEALLRARKALHGEDHCGRHGGRKPIRRATARTRSTSFASRTRASASGISVSVWRRTIPRRRGRARRACPGPPPSRPRRRHSRRLCRRRPPGARPRSGTPPSGP